MKKFIFLLSLLFLNACIRTFTINYTSPSIGYLVVEGVVNSGIGQTIIKVSRSSGLSYTDSGKIEMGAIVFVEDSSGNSQTLIDQKNGLYMNPQLNLDHNNKFRLHIKTSNGNEYISKYQFPISSSPIDSISWIKNSNGVNINLNAHNGNGKIINYHISTCQTWEIISPYPSLFTYVNGLNPRIDTNSEEEKNSLKTCWHTDSSAAVQIASTAQLMPPQVLLYSLAIIPLNSQILNVEYSILAVEYALNNEGYTYFQQLKANTEPGNSLFNPQPARINGNIYNIKDSTEYVIGYISIADVYSKRIFITNNQIQPWNYHPYCPVTTTPFQPSDNSTLVLFESLKIINGTIFPNQWELTPQPCVDCQIFGSPIKPKFWPN